MRTSSRSLLGLWPYGLLLAVGLVLYGQSLSFGYVWDDHALFLDSTLLREGVWSWATVARPILPDTPYFRPLVLGTWMAEMQLFQLNPLYSHAVNVVLHCINTCLLYAIACRVFERYQRARSAALFAALLYATHPCLVESVAWISGRFDLLATTLLMAACAVAMGPGTVVRGAVVALFSLGAMLSKETGVLLAPILVLLWMARRPAQPLRVTLGGLWPYLLAYALAVAAYFVLRRHGLGYVSYAEFGGSQILNAILRYEVWVRTLSFYTFMSFVPFSSLSPRHDMVIELASFRQHYVALAASLVLLVTVVWFAILRKTWALLWLAFYVGVFPVLGLFTVLNGETIGAERFLYLPLAMLALTLVALFLALRERYPQRPAISRVGITLAAGWLVLSLFVTYTVTSMWESSLRLWSWQYRMNPGNTLIRTGYLGALSRTSSTEAEAEFKAEIEKIRASHAGRLPVDVQIVYSAALLVRNDPEALNYLQGLVENSQRLWPDVHKDSSSVLDRISYAGVLSNYSQALMVFEGDLEGARAYLQQAQALSIKGSEYQILHQQIALEFLAGRKSFALDLYRKNYGLLQAYNIQKMHESIRTLTAFTCLRRNGENCHERAGDFITYLKENSAPDAR